MTRPQLVRLFAAVAATVLLSSCKVESRISLQVKPNGTGTISVVATADKAIVDKAPDLKGDIRTDDLVAAGWKIDGPTENEDGGLTITMTHPFSGPAEATALFTQINGSRGPLHDMVLARTGKDTNSTFTLAGRLEVNGGLEAFADDATLTLLDGAPYAAEVAAAGLDLGDAISIEFEAALPGKVDATTGQVADNTITWRVPTDGSPTDIATSVTNVDVASSISRVARVLILGLLAIWVTGSVVLILMVMNARNKRTPTSRI